MITKIKESLAAAWEEFKDFRLSAKLSIIFTAIVAFTFLLSFIILSADGNEAGPVTYTLVTIMTFAIPVAVVSVVWFLISLLVEAIKNRNK